MSCTTDRVVAAGTKLFAQFSGEGGFTQVASIVSLGGPEQSAESIDVTQLDPYEGGAIPANPEFWKEYMAGWRDGGQVTFTIRITQAGYVRLRTPFGRGLTNNWYIQLRNGMQIPFCAFITGFGETHEIGGLVECPITLKVTGATGVTTTTTT